MSGSQRAHKQLTPAGQTKVTLLSLELLDPFPQLGSLTASTALLGRLALQSRELLLDVDKVEDDVEYSGQQQREEKSRAGEID